MTEGKTAAALELTEKEKIRIRDLAKRWMEIAGEPVMEERKRLWQAVNDLKMERPVILIETSCIDGFLTPDDLVCENPFFREVEQQMVRWIRQFEEVGDDIILEPYFRMGWQIDESSYGVDVEMKPGLDGAGETSLGYTFNFPIQEPEDFPKLKTRNISVDRPKTERYRAALEDAFGDTLPVKVGNIDPLSPFEGDPEWVGMFFFSLTWQIFRFIGNDNLLYWVYDEPDMIHRLMEYMTDDRLRMFNYLEEQKLIVPNTDNQMAGPRHYGYVSELPAPDKAETEGSGKGSGQTSLKDCWGWPESQESVNISPEMFKEFVLPYYARLAKEFGLVYYGCCEPVDDRIDYIKEAMPNLRAVSISGWADFELMAEKLGREIVYSRKPTPAYLSGARPDWELAEQDMKKTYEATKKNGSNVQLLIRDLYTINGERPRLKKWVDMTKSILGF
jgi:hypothetical protein